MSRKEKFLRKCISCNAFKEKSDLIKITKKFDSEDVIVMPDSSVTGRSVYICKNKNCVDIAIKKMKMEKFLKKKVNPDVKENIRTVLEH